MSRNNFGAGKSDGAEAEDDRPGGFEGGLTNRKYRGITKTTRETAKRDMSDLVTKGILVKMPGGGRSSSL